MKKAAFLFPGQGSQSVGMGLDFFQEYDFVREIFDMAEEISKINISKLCFKGPMEDLTETVNLQPAITAVNLGCLAAIEKEGIEPLFTSGHSLGEYSALCACSTISKQDTLRLVFRRGQLMHRDATVSAGAMHAVIGLPMDAVKRLVAEVRKEGVVAVANHNAELQIVVTGAPDPVKKVSELAAAEGAKSIPLKVSGAWHSDLIKDAQTEFKALLGEIDFADPKHPIVLNVTGDVATDAGEIKSIMMEQLCSPVRWYDAMCRLIEKNVEVFAEVGPGKVLTGLLRKILPKDYPHKVYNLNSMKQLEAFFKDMT